MVKEFRGVSKVYKSRRKLYSLNVGTCAPIAPFRERHTRKMGYRSLSAQSAHQRACPAPIAFRQGPPGRSPPVHPPCGSASRVARARIPSRLAPFRLWQTAAMPPRAIVRVFLRLRAHRTLKNHLTRKKKAGSGIQYAGVRPGRP